MHSMCDIIFVVIGVGYITCILPACLPLHYTAVRGWSSINSACIQYSNSKLFLVLLVLHLLVIHLPTGIQQYYFHTPLPTATLPPTAHYTTLLYTICLPYTTLPAPHLDLGPVPPY